MSKKRSHEDLIQRFEKMIVSGKNYFFDLNEFLEIIDHYIFIGNNNMAWKSLREADKQNPGNPDIALFKAELLSQENKFEEALEIIEGIQKIKIDIEVFLLEADIYSRTNHHLKAVKALQKALKNQIHDPEIYDLLTIEYLYLDDYENALKAALLSLKFDPENQAALYNAISCYDYLSLTDKSIQFLESYVDKQPLSEIGWSLLAKKYLEKKEYYKALNALDYAIAIDDKFLGAYYDKAFVLTHLGNYNDAINLYKITLEISDPTPFAYYHIAKNYELDQQPDKAIEFYNKALDEDPGHYKSWYKLINLLEKNNKFEEALQKSLEAIKISPTQQIYEQHAELLLKQNQIEKAIKALENSIKFGPLKVPVVLQLADLYLKIHDKENYRSLLLEANKQFPDCKKIQNKMSGN